MNERKTGSVAGAVFFRVVYRRPARGPAPAIRFNRRRATALRNSSNLSQGAAWDEWFRNWETEHATLVRTYRPAMTKCGDVIEIGDAKLHLTKDEDAALAACLNTRKPRP